ncbi:MAG TPA: hypothetical protein VF387_01200, partial [Gemmatimonadaceae bacterium]
IASQILVRSESRKMQRDAGIGQRPDFLRTAKSSADNWLKSAPPWNGICNNHLNEKSPNPNNLSRT